MGTSEKRATRRNLRYRRQQPKPTDADSAMVWAQHKATEASAVAQAEPHDAVRSEAAQEAYEAYEAACRARGVCREYGCYRRTRRRRCSMHT